MAAGVYFHCGTANSFTNNIVAGAGRGGEMQRRLLPGMCNKGGNPTWPDIIHGFAFERNIVLVTEPDGASTHSVFGHDDDRNTSFAKNVYFATDPTNLAALRSAKVWPAERSWAAWQAQGQDTQSVIADPKFRDWRSGDFRLEPDSPAIGLGFRPLAPATAGCTAGANPWCS